MSDSRSIHVQGDFDGACFMYSIANAYRTIIGEPVNFKVMAQAFGLCQHPRDLLCGFINENNNYANNIEICKIEIDRVLRFISGDKLQANYIDSAPTTEEIISHIDHHSAVVARYKGDSKHQKFMEHWVCVVGPDDANRSLLLACSNRLLRQSNANLSGYKEHVSSMGRVYNDELVYGGEYTLSPGAFVVKRNEK